MASSGSLFGASRLCLCVLAIISCVSAVEIIAGNAASGYVRLDAGFIQIGASGVTQNVETFPLTVSNLSQPSVFVPWPQVVCGGITYYNVSAHVAVLVATFNDTTDGGTIGLNFTFQASAVYNATSPYAQLCDDNSTVFLSQLALIITDSDASSSIPLPVDPATWNWTSGKSFSCDNSFIFSADLGQGISVGVALGSVQMQTFMATPAFSDADGDAKCPPTTGHNMAGIIVGGVMVGIAVLGILIFGCKQCRKSNSYELLNP